MTDTTPCPRCGADVTYRGIVDVECRGYSCPNYKAGTADRELAEGGIGHCSTCYAIVFRDSVDTEALSCWCCGSIV